MPLSVVIVVAPPAPVTVIIVTGTTWFEMVITSCPYTPDPSLAVALAVMVPLATAVTSPDAFMVACPVPFCNDQVTVLLDALEGNTAALN